MSMSGFRLLKWRALDDLQVAKYVIAVGTAGGKTI